MPTYGEQPAPMAGAPTSSRGGGMANVLSLVAVILAVVALVIGFAVPGPLGSPGAAGAQGLAGATGVAGATGPAGPQGPQGDPGLDGTNGLDGADGLDGLDGLHCWDLNGNGVPDVGTEDLNADLAVDVLDCTGPRGPVGTNGVNGLDGLHCWDLNGNGVPDVGTEDLNSDGAVDVLDCRGPAGPGNTLASNSNTAFVPILGGVCSAYTGADVAITVPGPGTVVVQAVFMIRLDHILADNDEVDVYLESSPGLCIDLNSVKLVTVDVTQPSGIYWDEVSMLRPFTVPGAGTYTYYVNGVGFGGVGVGDVYAYASLVAVFYPS